MELRATGENTIPVKGKAAIIPRADPAIPLSTVLRKSVKFFVINIFLVKNFKISKLISGKWSEQSVNILSEWLRDPGKGLWGVKIPKISQGSMPPDLSRSSKSVSVYSRSAPEFVKYYWKNWKFFSLIDVKLYNLRAKMISVAAIHGFCLPVLLTRLLTHLILICSLINTNGKQIWLDMVKQVNVPTVT